MVGDYFVTYGNLIGGADELPEAEGEKVCAQVADCCKHFHPGAVGIRIEYIAIVEATGLRLRYLPSSFGAPVSQRAYPSMMRVRRFGLDCNATSSARRDRRRH